MNSPFDIVDVLAEALHKEYRATSKAMKKPEHDHGFSGCHNQLYFRKRATLLIERSTSFEPLTLGDAEANLQAIVLRRRLFFSGEEI